MAFPVDCDCGSVIVLMSKKVLAVAKREAGGGPFIYGVARCLDDAHVGNRFKHSPSVMFFNAAKS